MNEILSKWGGGGMVGMQVSGKEGKLQGGSAASDSESGSERIGL